MERGAPRKARDSVVGRVRIAERAHLDLVARAVERDVEVEHRALPRLERRAHAIVDERDLLRSHCTEALREPGRGTDVEAVLQTGRGARRKLGIPTRRELEKPLDGGVQNESAEGLGSPRREKSE